MIVASDADFEWIIEILEHQKKLFDRITDLLDTEMPKNARITRFWVSLAHPF